jgi:hypothetical protein
MKVLEESTGDAGRKTVQTARRENETPQTTLVK